jgi:biopolymer transport protein ExbD
MTFKKLSAASTAAAVALFLVAGTAQAAEINVDLSNKDTGNNSKNENTVIIKIKKEQESRRGRRGRRANHVHTSIRVHANTGGNSQDKNTSSGDLDTGNIDFTFTITN